MPQFQHERQTIITNACCISHDLIKCRAYVRLQENMQTIRCGETHVCINTPTAQSSIYHASSSPTRFNLLKSQLVFHHSEWEIYIHDRSCLWETFATSIVWLEQVTLFIGCQMKSKTPYGPKELLVICARFLPEVMLSESGHAMLLATHPCIHQGPTHASMFFSKASQRLKSNHLHSVDWLQNSQFYILSKNKIWYKQQPEIAHETVSNSGPKRLQHIQKQTKHSNWAFLQSVGPPHLHRRSACPPSFNRPPILQLTLHKNGWPAHRNLQHQPWRPTCWLNIAIAKRKIQWGTLAVLPGALSQ